jgi:peptide/nickel transport system substrate-binding protein
MKKRIMTQFALLVGISLAIFACGPAATEQATAPPQESGAPTAVPSQPTEVTAQPTAEARPSILRVGGVDGPDCLNMFACAEHWYFNYLAYEGLTGSGPNCDIYPRLAESWEQSDDGLTWTFHMHKGARFTDGTPFTAQTAVDYINWFNSTSLTDWFYSAWNIVDIQALDEYTLRITHEMPISVFADYDAPWWWMLPPHIWSQFDDDTMLTYEELPDGTGPYDITEWKPGEYIIYDAKPDYYLGEPPVDRIVYQQYANWDAVVQALLAGEIDVTESFVPASYYDTLAADPKITIDERPPGPIYNVTFNLFDGGNKHPAIDDPKLREAVDYAIDKQKALNIILEGHGILCPTNWACGSNYRGELNPDFTVTPFDLAMANQILDEAGYADSDGDGIRETADGQPLVFRLYFEVEDPGSVVFSDMLKESLSQIGISLDAEGLESGTLWTLELDERDFDMIAKSYVTDLDPAYLDYIASCWSAEAGISALNEAGYCSEELDNMIYEYFTTYPREAALEKIFEAQGFFYSQRPVISVVGMNMIEAFRSDNFEFPYPGNSCDMNPGYWDWPLVLQVKPK